MVGGQRLRCGLVGPARTRNGLGPFLADFLEQAGAHVAAVSGRDPARAAAAAAKLSERLGHAVAVEPSVEALAARGDLEALIIASPAEAHLAALRAALAGGLHVLCEKPLVRLEEQALVADLLDEFAARRRVLVENCVWPYALPALWQLHPGLQRQRLRSVEMMLSPAHLGVEMLADSLSHFISLVQALVPVDERTVVVDLEFSDPPRTAERLTMRLALESPFPRLRTTLQLEPLASQPRPAWFAVDGVRVDRRVQIADYSISYASAGREVSVGDPMAALVYGFVQTCRENDIERARGESLAVRHRARLYQQIVTAWCR